MAAPASICFVLGWFPYAPLTSTPIEEDPRRLRRTRTSAVATAAAAQTIALSIDGGHVRSGLDYQVRSFEVMIPQARNDDDKQIVFDSMPAEVDRQQDQLLKTSQCRQL